MGWAAAHGVSVGGEGAGHAAQRAGGRVQQLLHGIEGGLGPGTGIVEVVADLPVGVDGGGAQALPHLQHHVQQRALHLRDAGLIHGSAQGLQPRDGHRPAGR